MLYAVGDNPVAARLSGVRSWQVLVVLYVLSSLLAAVAGLLQSRLSSAAPAGQAVLDIPCHRYHRHGPMAQASVAESSVVLPPVAREPL